jgi:hypothetical protein
VVIYGSENFVAGNGEAESVPKSLAIHWPLERNEALDTIGLIARVALLCPDPFLNG